ncbi:MAG: flagellar biosynthesis protein FlhF [Rhodanobacter sp.]|nr:MAG: flagellar biosynthesis protein FlhF [Rhodanobacter sp.]TAM06997.1 MAG: flagellar biosynthesis protein FlhF [Rhodanobacter sp.]TAM39522.1 MAG: flagellar biosynthesis protein FlhF [Rhodanobacter sp.]TAN28364.1 MAG: flagellar biosynthesis protein FlhF [Rhodanobacter sp.]
MKIKRFVAADMRQAMREVRDEQGPDAVILSTRRIADGIEIIAALDYDEALMREASRQGAPSAAAPPSRAESPASPPRAAATPPSLAPRAAPPLLPVAARATPPPSAPSAAAATAPRPVPAGVPAPTLPVVERPVLAPLMERAAQDTAHLRSELGSMREMLEMQLSSLAWNDLERRQPWRARILREMTRIGIDADVARTLVDEFPEQIDAEQARYLPLGMLTRRLAVSGRGLVDDAPGVTALVGPTGVGKTTTIAKLAARAVLQRGADEVALVSTDHYRIGATAQLEHYGRLLGVRVYPAYDGESLRKVLEILRGRHSVLIDTAGVAGNDPRLNQQLDILADANELRATLVLAANTHAQSLDDAVRAYLPLNLHSCILTKLDEAPNLGGALSVLIRHRLPLDYITDGQRVPEDIHVADARVLVCRAAQSLHSSNPDDHLMAERFGLAVAHA